MEERMAASAKKAKKAKKATLTRKRQPIRKKAASARKARSAAAPLSGADLSAIRAASQAYTQAANIHDWARWAGFFTDDGIFLPPNTAARTGRGEIEAWGRAFPPMKDLQIEPLEIDGRGDLAFARGRYSLVIALPNQPEVRDVGKYIEIWRKQADGSWKVFRDTFNSDVPLAPA
jgi:uncharacterized protein (TIGR02246 family)